MERTEPLAVAVPVLVDVVTVTFISMVALLAVIVLDIVLNMWLALCGLRVGEGMTATVDGRVLTVEAVIVVPPTTTQGITSK